VQQVLDDLKQHGMALSLDDFGTGYSSLTRLNSLPFDELKIDASFVAALSSDTQSLRIVTAVLGLGQSLGLTVVAEGVESTEQAAVLRKLGCDVGQGFLWSPAACQALQLLQQWGAEAPQTTLDVSPFQRLHQLEALYQDSPVGLCFIDCQMRIVSANQLLAHYLGVELDYILQTGQPDIRP
jgi:EAL domain-containing protein (putative c-di-GMP-specific phosphodiesterase class I)